VTEARPLGAPLLLLIRQPYLCEGVGHPGITLRAGPERSLLWGVFGRVACGRPRAATGNTPKNTWVQGRVVAQQPTRLLPRLRWPSAGYSKYDCRTRGRCGAGRRPLARRTHPPGPLPAAAGALV